MSVQTSKRFYLRKPTGKRKSIKLLLQTTKPDGTTDTETIKDKDIDAINTKLQAGVYSLTDALTHAEKVRLRLNTDLGVIVEHRGAYQQLAAPHNMRLMEKYFEAEYSYRQVRDEASAKNKLKRAVAAIGDLPLATADRGKLTTKIKGLPFSVSKKREITSSINQLLKFAKRDFKLLPPKKMRKKKIPHLTLEEFKKVLPNIKSPTVRALAEVAFYTGARKGEAYAVETAKIGGNYINIDSQITKNDEERDPKWDSGRPAFLFEEGREAIAKVEEARVLGMLPSHNAAYKAFHRACMKTFPNQKEKHIAYHDLRHSYAIRLLSKGVILDLVAQSLGNTIQVCQEYYAGYCLTHASLDMIASIVNADKEKAEKKG